MSGQTDGNGGGALSKEFKLVLLTLPAVEDRPFVLLVGHESFIRRKEKRGKSYKTHPIFKIISDKTALSKYHGSFRTLNFCNDFTADRWTVTRPKSII